MTFAAASTVRAGTPAAVSVLGGLVRSLPCYLIFCLVVALLAPSLGLLAVLLAVVACLGVGSVTWRTVPVAPGSTVSTQLRSLLATEAAQPNAR
jgi:hypothetical protein